MALTKHREQGLLKERNVVKMHAKISLHVQKVKAQLRIEKLLPETMCKTTKETRTLPLPKNTKMSADGELMAFEVV